jgi:flagellin-like hook-associated protein FlgL
LATLDPVSRFESALAHLASTADNVSGAESRIVDADIAEEASVLIKTTILQRSSAAVVAQTSLAVRPILRLLSWDGPVRAASSKRRPSRSDSVA